MILPIWNNILIRTIHTRFASKVLGGGFGLLFVGKTAEIFFTIYMVSQQYQITLPENQWVSLPQEHFYSATNGEPMPQETIVSLCHDTGSLWVVFSCRHDPFWKQTTPTQHNSDLWQQEVFEVFIAEGSDTPTRYLEVELNPNNALFVGWIDNPTREGDANTLTMIPYGQSGIEHRITGSGPDWWQGELRIPLSLLSSSAKGPLPHSRQFRINFYRIVLIQSQTIPDWTCSPSNASFQCWSPTLSGKTPRFHRPESFGHLRLL